MNFDKEFDKQEQQLKVKYNGANGLPKFNRDQVARYGLEHGILDLEAAYKIKYWKEIIEWYRNHPEAKI